MPSNYLAYPSQQLNNVTVQQLHVPNGSILINTPEQSLTYSKDVTNMNVANVIDLNNRSFTFVSMVCTRVTVGASVSVRVSFNLIGTAGSVNKYEITLPTLATPPTVVRGIASVYDSTNTNSIDIASCLVYSNNKLRIFNANVNNILLTSTANDYSFATGRSCFCTVQFQYNL